MRQILYTFATVCLIIFFLGIWWSWSSALSRAERFDVAKELSLLNRQERQDLEYAFEYWFFFDALAYPLFGGKPMSIGYLRNDERFVGGWAAWQKISPFFSSDQFVIGDYTFRGKRFILIANLDLVEKTFDQNKEAFDQVFKGRMTSAKLRECLRARDDCFQEVLSDEKILGILLGYGAHNADLFVSAQNTAGPKFLGAFSDAHPIFYCVSKVLPPCFACDPSSEETAELKRRYHEDWKTLAKMNRQDPLLFHMLRLLKTEPTK